MIGVLGLLRSPVTKYVAFALAVLAAIAWLRADAADQATMVAQAECQQTFSERVDAEVSRQVRVTETVLKEAQRRAVLTESEVAALQERADELLGELRARGQADSCPLDTDTIRRLRDIR